MNGKQKIAFSSITEAQRQGWQIRFAKPGTSIRTYKKKGLLLKRRNILVRVPFSKEAGAWDCANAVQVSR
jgi:hypothetical protein